MNDDKDTADVLSDLLKSKLSKNPELAAKQARLLAVLAAQKRPAVETNRGDDEVPID